jgi:N-acetylmuramoyl-L-alanine amidase
LFFRMMKRKNSFGYWHWLVLLSALLAYPTRAQQLIQKAETLPAGELWLSPGDALQVRLVGEPGGQASFLNGRPLVELAPAQAGGLAGVYQGTYYVQPNDTLDGPAGASLWLHCACPTAATTRANGGSSAGARPPAAYAGRSRKMRWRTLNYGLGEDRLGGAKIGYLDSLVLLHVVGRAGEHIPGAAGRGQYAWVPQNVVRLLPLGGFVPASLTGSWDVRGDSPLRLRAPAPHPTAALPFQLLQKPTRL